MLVAGAAERRAVERRIAGVGFGERTAHRRDTAAASREWAEHATAIPLMLFAASATRVPLTVLGLLEYITPIGLFIIGIAFFHETMSPARWVGFILIWIALVVFSVDELRHPHQAKAGDEFLIPEQ